MLSLIYLLLYIQNCGFSATISLHGNVSTGNPKVLFLKKIIVNADLEAVIILGKLGEIGRR